uniref:GH16 domain-containing protein n=1 Tax=Palpitomonas bilix TaxID=652834 RepID=A0A7S3DIZ0_9EUKA|mmetsp:Transcript_39596/g.101659  ORF Transcript_39596/g.101659 Transcript_39596/m.101659 type:complete len:268 (+) Transcript_39596:218-1021(+)
MGVIGGVVGFAMATKAKHATIIGMTDASRAGVLPTTGVKDFTNLVFSDDFDTLNFSVWQHEITASGAGNWEFEYYTNNRSNSYVNDSVLYIQPTLTSETYGSDNVWNGFTLDLWGSTPADQCTSNAFYGCSRAAQADAGGNAINPIQSARLRTVNSFSFKYGRVEVRAKLPKGDWLWPAIWLIPEHNEYGQWPASGEIDIMESRGNAGEYGINSFGSTLHWGPYFGQDPYSLTHEQYTVGSGSPSLADDFHVYGLYWVSEGEKGAEE